MELTIFIAVTSAAVVLQACVLLAMYLTMRKTSAKFEALAEEVRTKVLPTAEIAYSMLVELRPKVESLIADVSESTAMVRTQLGRLDATVSDVVDRARLQVIRADDMLSRTLDRVEQTTEMVHSSVISPIRHVAGMIQGLTAGLEYLVGARRRRRDGAAVPQDEMFI
jgi:chromatin segregation and condensation protein Rec8/ScpA/Scc1 (kleisin family)